MSMSNMNIRKHELICSLCQMHFVASDDLLIARLKRHTEFHEKARIQKRNTTQGTPSYEVSN